MSNKWFSVPSKCIVSHYRITAYLMPSGMPFKNNSITVLYVTSGITAQYPLYNEYVKYL